VSGTVFAPTGPVAGRRPVVAWAHPTTGVASRCAPSIGADGGAGAIPGLAELLREGYVVVATDYPGLGTPGPHPYLVGQSEGRAVLDSARAAAALDGAAASTTVGLWGHSQGGHAALFAGQLAPTYAPDLDVVGVAAAAPATSLAELLRRDVGGVSGNVLASMALSSWSEVYADRGLTLDALVARSSIPLVGLIAEGCVETTAQQLVELPAAEVLQMRFLEADPWAIPPWDEVLAENTPGATAIAAPVLVVQGSADTVVWPGVTSAWVDGQCGLGVVIDERVYDGRTHTEIARTSAGDVRSWLGDRVAGRRPASSCPPAP
jgi:pimeloyl-ACP methyl ester carboxylesterase